MWHTLDLTEVVRKLRSNINYGITNEEAKIRLEKYGKNKLEDIKDKVTDEIYTMYESQLATLEVKGEQNIMKDIQLKQSCLRDVTNQNGTVTIKTNYVIEMYDYIADVNTKKLIRGEDKEKICILYEMSFRKALSEDEKVTHCPNCGAKVEMNSTGTCEYCGSKLVSENTKWVLTEKKVIEQYYI